MRYLIWMFLLSFCTCTAPDESAKAALIQENAVLKMVMPTSLAQDTLTLTFDLNYLMGKFDPTQHSDFVLIAPEYADREGMYLRSDTYAAFKQMHSDALKEGIKLVIRSATRNFEAQKTHLGKQMDRSNKNRK
ncbi:MAG: M15 family metallopeptidase [Saprospiraceae bacterium]|nr:M15 family metallopeptidase [Saprospiraceae bacterium]